MSYYDEPIEKIVRSRDDHVVLKYSGGTISLFPSGGRFDGPLDTYQKVDGTCGYFLLHPAVIEALIEMADGDL